MLTKSDLSAIAQIVDERLDNRLGPVNTDIKSMRSDIRVLQKDFRIMLAMLNRADVELRNRVERIEEHLGLSKLQ